MAYVKLNKKHKLKNQSVKNTIKKHIDYITNPEKTDLKTLITTYHCSDEANKIPDEFIARKKIYETLTGRSQPDDRDIIGYSIIQSFKIDEVTPELANKIGTELVEKFTKNNHQYIVVTHIDKNHIHNHIYFNSTTIDCMNKFNDYKNTALKLRNMSDSICKNYNLSIINPMEKSKNYKEWLSNKKGTSWKTIIKNNIDYIVSNVKNFDDLLEQLRKNGYEIKKGKYISIRPNGQIRFVRLKTLGKEYTEERLQEKISLNKNKIDDNTSFKKFIDVENKKDKGKGYEVWADKFNLNESINLLNFVSENNLNFKDIEEIKIKANEYEQEFNLISEKIKYIEKEINTLSSLRSNIINYSKTRDLFKQYSSIKNKKEKNLFYENNKNQIETHIASKKLFEDFKLRNEKYPTMAEIKIQFENLVDTKKELYKKYKLAKSEMIKYKNLEYNFDIILKEPDTKQNIKNKNIEK